MFYLQSIGTFADGSQGAVVQTVDMNANRTLQARGEVTTMADKLTIAQLLQKYGVSEGNTRIEAPYVRDTYTALANGTTDVYVFGADVPEALVADWRENVADDDALMFVVEDDASAIKRKLTYRNTAAKTHGKVTYGTVTVKSLSGIGAHVTAA